MDAEASCFPGNCLVSQMGKLLSKSKGHASKYGVPGDSREPEPGGLQFNQYSPVHTESVSSVFPAGPGLCLSGGKDLMTVLFNFKKGQIVGRWTGHHEKDVTKVTYGGDAYFSASRDKTVCMWKTGETEPVNKFVGHELVVTGASLNADGTQLCTGSRDNSIRLWDVTSGSCTGLNNVSRNLITDVKWAVGAEIIAQTSEDKELRIWDPRTLQVCQSFPRKQYIQTCCDISADNNYCLTSSNGFQGNGCEATLWDLRTTKLVCEYKGHIETVAACTFLPSSISRGRNLIATSSNDCSIKIWDREGKDCVSSLTIGGSGPLTGVAAYDDGSVAVSTFHTGVQVLQVSMDSSGRVAVNRTAQY